jgi:hypothetical protein
MKKLNPPLRLIASSHGAGIAPGVTEKLMQAATGSAGNVHNRSIFANL